MSVDNAYKIDNKNNDTFWRDFILKEMHNVSIDFEILDRNHHVILGWNKVTGHMVFDINMDFSSKER